MKRETYDEAFNRVEREIIEKTGAQPTTLHVLQLLPNFGQPQGFFPLIAEQAENVKW